MIPTRHNTFAVLFLAALTLTWIDPIASQNETNWFPKFHIRPEKGWINDPNGLVYFNGFYHVFWQYTPNEPVSGLKHWGHAKSADLLAWEYLPIALAPSLTEDIDGIFSGSAVVKDDNITVIYTGVSESSSRQRQMTATSADGLNFEKLGVVIDRDGDEHDFRDPKAWWQDDSWFVVIGTKTPEGRGEAGLYKSLDFVNWTYEGPLADADEKLGFMWECPDFFTLDGKQILAFSPVGVQPDGYDFLNNAVTGYFVGSWTPGSNYTIEKGFREIDHGHDFYASQTFLAPDGRRILIAWMGAGSQYPEQSSGWAGMLTLPRELTLSESGDLEIRPIREIQHARVQTLLARKPVVLVDHIWDILGSPINPSEISMTFNLTETTSDIFGVQLTSDEDVLIEGVYVYVNRSEGRLFLKRNYPQYNIELSYRSIPIDLTLPDLSLDIFLDRSSIEVFVNGGQAVLTSRIYPNEDQRFFYIFTNGGNLTVYDIAIWDI